MVLEHRNGTRLVVVFGVSFWSAFLEVKAIGFVAVVYACPKVYEKMDKKQLRME